MIQGARIRGVLAPAFVIGRTHEKVAPFPEFGLPDNRPP